MTPLQQALVRELMKPPGKRQKTLGENLTLFDMVSARAFECSAVSDLQEELSLKFAEAGALDDRVIFLPAPLTWIEFGSKDQHAIQRMGLLLAEVSTPEGSVCRTDIVFLKAGGELHGPAFEPLVFPMQGHKDYGSSACLGLPWHDKSEIEKNAKLATMVYSYLALINSPAHIARRDRDPHKGLVKELRAHTAGKVRPEGKWTEILLEVPRTEESEDGPAGQRLTGAKALHYCRRHARIRLGRLEFVRGHWRGDAGNGTTLSSHRLVPPRPPRQ